MSRSLKKGPYVLPVLLKRVEEMNKTGEKKGSENLEPRIHYLPGFRGSHILPYMTGANTFRSM